MSGSTPEYGRVYQNNRYHRRRSAAKNYLGGKCAQCGSTLWLELDHIDPNTKSFDVSKLWGVAEDRFWQEIAKCQLLCKKHHHEKTKLERTNPKHGTWGWVRNRKCKCDVCREFVRNYQNSLRKRKKERS